MVFAGSMLSKGAVSKILRGLRIQSWLFFFINPIIVIVIIIVFIGVLRFDPFYYRLLFFSFVIFQSFSKDKLGSN